MRRGDSCREGLEQRATRAILALALEGGGPLKLEELARRTAVPQSVLDRVMPIMRTSGLVRSERGSSGG